MFSCLTSFKWTHSNNWHPVNWIAHWKHQTQFNCIRLNDLYMSVNLNKLQQSTAHHIQSMDVWCTRAQSKSTRFGFKTRAYILWVAFNQTLNYYYYSEIVMQRNTRQIIKFLFCSCYLRFEHCQDALFTLLFRFVLMKIVDFIFKLPRKMLTCKHRGHK